MSLRFRHVGMVLSLSACLAAAGPVTGALASNTSLLAAFKSASPRINDSQAKVLKGLATHQKTHSAKALIGAGDAQNKVLRTLRSTVSKQSASSSTGSRAKADIVKGLGLIISSNDTLTKALVKSAHGTPVSRSSLKKSVSADKRGNTDVNAGITLLVKK